MSGGVAILYIYGAICVSMILFNIVYNLFQEGRDRRLRRHTRKYIEEICLQLERLERGRLLDPVALQDLTRNLGKVNELIAFDRAIEHVQAAGSSEKVEEFHRQIQPFIIGLADIYQHRENMQAAYYAYFLSRHCMRENVDIRQVEEVMLTCMERDSLYCRLNALQALYEFGSPESVAEVVAYQDRIGSFFHEKLLTDGLLTFKGDYQKLIAQLWERFPQLSNKSKRSVLNYIRFKSGDYIDQMRAIMEDPEQDKELRLSAIRYFGRYLYPPVKDRLLAFATDKDPLNWEYAAVAVTCLADYPGDDVTDALIVAVHSSNWYVRSNAAASLESRGLEYPDLIGIVGGKDRYAREMMMYQLDKRRMKKEEHQELEETTI